MIFVLPPPPWQKLSIFMTVFILLCRYVNIVILENNLPASKIAIISDILRPGSNHFDQTNLADHHAVLRAAKFFNTQCSGADSNWGAQDDTIFAASPPRISRLQINLIKNRDLKFFHTQCCEIDSNWGVQDDPTFEASAENGTIWGSPASKELCILRRLRKYHRNKSLKSIIYVHWEMGGGAV